MILTMALVVDRFVLGAAQENCYVVRADRGAAEAAVIDPGDGAAQLRLELAGMGSRCAGILITHCHWDHLLGVADLAEGTSAPGLRTGARAAGAGAAAGVLSGRPAAAVRGRERAERRRDRSRSRASPSRRRTSPATRPGHLAYYADGCLFSGDVLFAGSVGRTDLPFSDWETLLESIRTLFDRFSAETVVYPGHGPETTLGAEQRSNPFLAELRTG